MKQRLRVLTLVTMFLASVLCIFVDQIVPDTITTELGPLLLSISIGGAALFGATTSMLIEQAIGSEISDIQKYLMARERFESASDHLPTVSGTWHVYYLTKADNVAVWKYVTYSLHVEDNNRSLRGGFSVRGSNGSLHHYLIEAGIRGNSLVMVFRAAKGQEADAVEVVPRIANTNLEAYVGLQMLETWDGDLGVSYSIYSRSKLTEGDNLDETAQANLTTRLNRLCETHGIVDLRRLGTRRRGPAPKG